MAYDPDVLASLREQNPGVADDIILAALDKQSQQDTMPVRPDISRESSMRNYVGDKRNDTDIIESDGVVSPTTHQVPTFMELTGGGGSRPSNKRSDSDRVPTFMELTSGMSTEPTSTPADKSTNGFLGTIASGFKSTGRAIGAAVDLHQRDTAGLQQSAKAAADAARVQDPDLAAIKSDIQSTKERLGPDASWLDTGAELAKAAFNNPRGAALLVAEQLPNSAAAMGAGWAGFKSGGIAGGMVAGLPGAAVGSVVGGVIGMFGANYALEAGNKAIEAAQQDKLSSDDLDRISGEGAIKGGVITGVDSLTMGIGGKIFGATQRAVDRAGTRVLVEAGVDVSDRAAIVAAARANPALITAVQTAEAGAFKAASTLSQKAIRAGADISLETLGEGVGEYWGEGLASGNWDKMESLIEAFSSLGQSAGESAFVAGRHNTSAPRSVLPADILNTPNTQQAINTFNAAEQADVTADDDINAIGALMQDYTAANRQTLEAAQAQLDAEVDQGDPLAVANPADVTNAAALARTAQADQAIAATLSDEEQGIGIPPAAADTTNLPDTSAPITGQRSLAQQVLEISRNGGPRTEAERGLMAMARRDLGEQKVAEIERLGQAPALMTRMEQKDVERGATPPITIVPNDNGVPIIRSQTPEISTAVNVELKAAGINTHTIDGTSIRVPKAQAQVAQQIVSRVNTRFTQPRQEQTLGTQAEETVPTEQGQPESQPAATLTLGNANHAQAADVRSMLGGQISDEDHVGIIDNLDTLPTQVDANQGPRIGRPMAKAIKTLAGMLGRKVVFYETTNKEVAEGINRDGNTLYVNIDSNVDAIAVAGHEMVHSLEHEQPDLYEQLLDATKALLKSGGRDRAVAYAKYAGARNLDSAARELLSDIGGNEWRSGQFWSDVFDEVHRTHAPTEARSIITKIRDAVVAFINKLIRATPKQGFQHGYTREELAEIRDNLVKATAESFRRAERVRLGLAPTPEAKAGEVRFAGKREEDADNEPTRVFVEVAPDPNNSALTEAWRSQPYDERVAMSRSIFQKILPKVLSALGIKGEFSEQLGGYKLDTNPSFATLFDNANDAHRFSLLAGYALSQDSMMVLSGQKFDGAMEAGIIQIKLPGSATQEQVHQVYLEARGTWPGKISGHTTKNGIMHIVVPRKTALQVAMKVNKALGNKYEVKYGEGYYSFPQKEDYDYASEQGILSGKLPSTREDASELRAEASRLIQSELAKRGVRFSNQRQAPDAASGGLDGRVPEGEIEQSRPDGASGQGAGGGRAATDQGSKPGSISGLGVHYSANQRKTLVSSFFGSGLKGAELERVKSASDDRIKHRIYFYLNTGRGINPEVGVGSHAHTLKLDNIYDMTADQLDLRVGRDLSEFESALIDAGYDGYMTQESGIAVLLGQRVVTPDYIGSGIKPAVPLAGRAEPSAYGKAQQALADRHDLPSGRMKGSEWQKALPEMDLSHLDQDAYYYKDALLERPRFSAPRAQPWYYSQLEQGIRTMPAKVSGTSANNVALWLKSNADKLKIKKEEIEWSGVMDYLASLGKEKVTAEQLADWVAENGVKVEEVVLGAKARASRNLRIAITGEGDTDLDYSQDDWIKQSEILERQAQSWQRNGDNEKAQRYFELSEEAAALAEGLDPESGSTAGMPKHASGNLVLPGGTDHREIVLTVPTIEPYNESDSTHYGDVGNGKQIAWARVNTRTDADGNKVLFVEEIQSQRNQHGRKNGFLSPDILKDGRNAEQWQAEAERRFSGGDVAGMNEAAAIARELRERARAQGMTDGRQVPTAPFVSTKDGKPVDSYIPLVLKRLIAYAVDTGHDAISWTTGEQQADRYDLSKQIKSITAHRSDEPAGTFYSLEAIGTNGRPLEELGQMYRAEQLEEVLGKDLAEKIINQPDASKTYSGLDLKVGGGWTASMYGDSRGLDAKGKPSMIAAAARKLGAEVGGVGVNVKQGTLDVIGRNGELILRTDYDSEAHATARENDGARVIPTPDLPLEQPGFTITPAMQEQASKGMPLFSKQRITGEFSDTNPDIRYSAPRAQPWYYSQLEQGIRTMPAKVSGTSANNVALWLKSNADKLKIKKEEIEWSGVMDYLASLGKEKVTAEQLADWVAENGVNVEEVVLGDPDEADIDALLNDEAGDGMSREDAIEYLRNDEGSMQTKHASGNLVLPGGTDHREIVLTVPTIEPYKESDSIHYGDVGNGKQIAWARVNTRTDADGKKVLFVEEIQSQRNQHGRTKGFDTASARLPANPATYADIVVGDEIKGWGTVQAIRDGANGKEFDVGGLWITEDRFTLDKVASRDSGHLNAGKNKALVPTAPFVSTKDGKPVDSYISLILKRLIAYAVDTGHDAISWTTGEQQADRYDLSKQIDTIYSGNNGDGTWAISAKKGDTTMFRQDRLPEKDLPEYVGKDAADKIIASGDGIKLSGLDLKVGGGWTASMYGDSRGLDSKGKPSMISAAARKLGAEVGVVDIDQTPKGGVLHFRAASEGGTYRAAEEKALMQQPGFTITPAMQEQASKGMPLFSKQRIIGDSGRQYTNEQKDLFKHVGREVDEKTTLEKLKSWIWKNWVQGLFDQFAPVKNLSSHAYTLMRLSKGSTGAFEAFLHHGKLSIRDGAFDADTSGGAIESVFVPVGKEATDLLYWIAGNRAEKLFGEDREHLFSPDDIAAAKSLATGQTDFDYTLPNGTVTRNRALIYRDTLRKFNEFNKNILDMAEQSGLIDGASRHLWEHEFYVPFYRVTDEKGGGIRGMNIKQGVIRQQAFKQLKGGTEGLNDLLANTLMNWAHLIDASAKNRAAKATIDAAVNLGAARKAVAGEKNVVWYSDKGRKAEFVVDDPGLLVALNGLEYAGLRGPAMDALSATKHWLTMGVTASPFFKVRNLIRDSIQSIAVSDLSYNPLHNVKEGWKLTNRASQEYVSALAGGGLIRFGTMLEGSEAARTRQLIKQGSKDSHILDGEGKLKAFYDKVIEPAWSKYQELGNRGEEINRMALYDKLIAEGKTHAEAALAARDLMDFSMSGAFTSVRFLTQVVPFLNARLQGLYKLGKGAKEDKARFAIVMAATALAGLAMMGYASGDDDRWKRWKKREQWDKDNYWMFSFGDVDYRIPKPFEIGAMATLVERGFETAFMLGDEKNKWSKFGYAVLKIASDQLSMNPVPQLVKPILDIYANKDSFSGRPIETMSMERLKKDYRFNAGTSMFARGASTAGNTIADVAGMEFLSPVQIDHLVRSYFGWVGAAAVASADFAIRPMTNEPSRPEKDMLKWMSGGMVTDKDSAGSRYVSHLYDQLGELESAYGTWQQLRKEGKADDAREFAADHRDELRQYRQSENVKQRLSEMNKQIRMIERSDRHPAEKRILINRIRARQSDMAERLN